MASFSRASGTTLGQPILFQGYLLKPGSVPGQWSLRYFVLMHVQRELALKWWPDSNSRLEGHQPTGCLFLRPTSTATLKSADIMEISGVHNPEKPQKTKYSLKSSPTNLISECMGVLHRWLAAQGGRDRSLSMPAFPHQFDATDDPASVPSSMPDPQSNASKFFLARTLFAHAASDDQCDELSFQPGATIRVFEQSDTGWWRGALEGSAQHGWFPSNFVRRISSAAVTEKPACIDAVVLFYAIAVHDYEADGHEGEVGLDLKELSIRAHDCIAVTITHTNGWWFGTVSNGESGWFPSNYVEVLG
jgi:hypothetical protein